VVEESIDARTPQAAVFAGFFGVDLSNVRDIRLLNVAARVLSTRMMKTIREGKQLVYSIGASSEPAVIYPGFGLFAAVAPTDPGKAPALAVRGGVRRRAGQGRADGGRLAKQQMANLLTRS
jgi:predicted Zn-dependent peptidase